MKLQIERLDSETRGIRYYMSVHPIKNGYAVKSVVSHSRKHFSVRRKFEMTYTLPVESIQHIYRLHCLRIPYSDAPHFGLFTCCYHWFRRMYGHSCNSRCMIHVKSLF